LRTQELKEEIARLKAEKKAVILAHNYQLPLVQDVADFLGDSLELAKRVRKLRDRKIIVFCGVYFMAETARIINPDKKVIIPDREAGCALAEGLRPEELVRLKQQHPEAKVVCYVNSSAEIKALSDYCCTSANAVEVVEGLRGEEIIFVPDINLGRFVAWRLKRKIVLPASNCYVHHRFLLRDVQKARRLYPRAKIVVHPESPLEVIEASDYALSTSGMLKLAAESSEGEFVIGTEISMLYRLRKEFPRKKFYALKPGAICEGMKKITLAKLYEALTLLKEEVRLKPVLIERARRPLERMLES